MKIKFCSRKQSRPNTIQHANHSIAYRRSTEIETIYRSYQDLLCKTALTSTALFDPREQEALAA
jgi:hypothetical protein